MIDNTGHQFRRFFWHDITVAEEACLSDASDIDFDALIRVLNKIKEESKTIWRDAVLRFSIYREQDEDSLVIAVYLVRWETDIERDARLREEERRRLNEAQIARDRLAQDRRMYERLKAVFEPEQEEKTP